MNYIEEDKLIADALKKSEELFLNYVKQAQEGLKNKTLNINGLEQLAIQTIIAFQNHIVNTTNGLASEESKKKFLQAAAKSAENMKSLVPKKATST